jgi:peptidoglycan/xylan/chitin deacetylase (PgdA/CDA1 family)
MRNVPTIMFHSVGLENHVWAFPHISESESFFESVMEVLAKEGFASHFFGSDIYGTHSGQRDVVLTFDDGYLDNFLVVLPILKRHGLKGTVFVSTDFVDREDVIRTRDDGIVGFLSFAEMREMEASGVFEIQSHAKTHTWYPSGDRIVDFWRPGIATEPNGPIWMLWNLYPEMKPQYLTRAAEMETWIPYGTPVYQHEKSLVCRRYFPDSALGEHLIHHVESGGGPAFFDRAGWREEIEAVATRYRSSRRPNQHYETPDAYRARVSEELSESKRVLESRLNKEVTCLCWPGGGVNDDVLEIAREIGYRRFSKPSALRRDTSARYEGMIPRIAGTSRVGFRGRNLGTRKPYEFFVNLMASGGNATYRALARLFLFLRVARHIGMRVW